MLASVWLANTAGWHHIVLQKKLSHIQLFLCMRRAVLFAHIVKLCVNTLCW